jgi:hypothetical protein
MPKQVVGPLWAGNAGQDCRDDDCKDHSGEPGGCARITPIEVHLPLLAQVDAIHLFSAAPDHTDLYENTPCEDIQWAQWLDPTFSTTPTNVVVTARFKNWSHDKDRYVQVVVDYRLGPRQPKTVLPAV